MEKQVCEVCGAPAVHAVMIGIKEINWNTGVIEIAPGGHVHYFCEAHKQDGEAAIKATPAPNT